MVICDLEEQLGDDGYYKGVPALIAEIISETSRSKDMVTKLDLYMACGVREYWIVNPLNAEVTVYEFKEQAISNSITYKKQGIAKSYLFEGLAVDVASLF